jgi:hypothetical protein
MGIFLLRLKWPKFHLRYVHFIAESAQYIFNNIPRMGGFFNWSMCNKRDADFWRPDGMIVQVKINDNTGDNKLLPERNLSKVYVRKWESTPGGLAKIIGFHM